MDDDSVLGAVGPRLRMLRQQRGATLAELSTTTGISVSTLSRMESGQRRPTLELLRHEGYEWMYVLAGRLRLLLGEHDLVLAPGDVAEFDTHVPHWLGSAGD